MGRNGLSREENQVLVEERLAKGFESPPYFICLDPGGRDVCRDRDILVCCAAQRELPAGACTITPEGSLLSYRADASDPRRSMLVAVAAIIHWLAEEKKREECVAELTVEAQAMGFYGPVGEAE